MTALLLSPSQGSKERYHWQAQGVRQSGVDDMVLLRRVSEDAIVENLRRRFLDGYIFVSSRPQRLPGLWIPPPLLPGPAGETEAWSWDPNPGCLHPSLGLCPLGHAAPGWLWPPLGLHGILGRSLPCLGGG